MAKRTDGRIEPTFEGRARAKPSAGFRSARRTASCRPAVSLPPKSKCVPRPDRRQSRRTGARRTVRRLRRLLYWCFVLAIWGGIAAAGIVVYYGARMPSVADWAVPDRPPNVKIVSVDGKLVANRGMTGGEAVGLHEMSPYIPRPSSPSRTAASIRISASIRSGWPAPCFSNRHSRPLHRRAARR